MLACLLLSGGIVPERGDAGEDIDFAQALALVAEIANPGEDSFDFTGFCRLMRKDDDDDTAEAPAPVPELTPELPPEQPATTAEPVAAAADTPL